MTNIARKSFKKLFPTLEKLVSFPFLSRSLSFTTKDILVNNAAYQGKAVKSFEEITHDRVVRTFNTNIIAMFSLCYYALPHMKEGGAIINVASIQAYNPSDIILDYASTKGAIVTFSKGLAQQVSLQQDSI